MCGLIGMIHYKDNGFDYESKQALLPMLLLNSMRGMHSTGLFGVTHKKKGDAQVEWVKRVGPPHGLLFEPEGKEFIDKMFQRFHVVIGHGRYATQGNITAKNAHPFTHGGITLVHNGNVRNLYEFKEKDQSLTTKFEVDSEGLTWLFNKEGAKNILKEIKGALALIWFDKKTGAIHAFRNSERPLFIIERAQREGILFSSEMETLSYLKDRFSTLKLKEPLTLEENYLYTFPIGSSGDGKYERTKIDVKKDYYGSYQSKWNASHRGYGDWGIYDLDGLEKEFDDGLRKHIAQNEASSQRGGPIIPFRRKHDTTVTRRAAAVDQLPSKETAPKAKLSSIVRMGFKYEIGGQLAFYNKTVKEVAQSQWYFQGTHVASDKVGVAAHVTGDISELRNEVILAGKIISILYVDGPTTTLNVYLEKVRKVPEDIQNAILSGALVDISTNVASDKGKGEDIPVFVATKGKTSLRISEAETLIEKGCARCSGQIRIEEVNDCLLVDEHSRATKLEVEHGGFYCPDCVAHRLTN